VWRVWDYWWMTDNTDSKINKLIWWTTTYGTWILYEWIKQERKYINTPKKKYKKVDGQEIEYIEFDKELTLIYHWIYSEVVPFKNFFINWTNLDNSTECVIIRYYDKDAYMAEKEFDLNYKNISKLKTIKDYNPFSNTEWYREVKDFSTTDWKIMEIEYINEALDERVILANWEEVMNSPIPYTHKKMPIAIMTDELAEWRIYWIWTFEQTEKDEKYKNELRTLWIRWIYANIWVLLKDKSVDTEVNEVEFWIWETVDVDDLNGFKQLNQSVDVGSIKAAEAEVDNDIMAKTWIDFKSLFLSSSETATKTSSKNASWRKRINKIIKDNAFEFYRRLWELRMKNIQFLHSSKTMDIPIEWGNITEDWVFEKEDWYGSMTVKSNYTKWDFKVIPVIDTMLWNTKMIKREEALQYAQVAWNIAWEDWKPVIKWTQLAKLITDEFDYDFADLTEATSAVRKWKDIIDEFDKKEEWIEWTPLDDKFIPPEQRNMQQAVPTVWSSANRIIPNE
jgi:hypothetical protein